MNRISLLLVLIVVGLVSRVGFTEELPQDSAAKLAEYIFFSNANSANLGDWIKNSPLSSSHKQAAQAYLVGHELQKAPSPKMFWKAGTSKLIIGDEPLKYTIEFANLVLKNELMINGKALKVDQKTDFSELVKAIGRARGHDTHALNVFNLYAQSAHADSGDTSGDVQAAISYWSGVDQISACQGDEIVTKSLCVFRSDSSMILADIGGEGIGQIFNFICHENKFNSISYRDSSGWKQQMKMSYENDKLAKIQTYQYDDLTCTYTVNNGKLVSVNNVSLVPNYCNGRTIDEYASLSHSLKPGDKPKMVGSALFPIQRLQSCCASKSCQNDMKTLVAKANHQPTKSKTQSSQ